MGNCGCKVDLARDFFPSFRNIIIISPVPIHRRLGYGITCIRPFISCLHTGMGYVTNMGYFMHGSERFTIAISCIEYLPQFAASIQFILHFLHQCWFKIGRLCISLHSYFVGCHVVPSHPFGICRSSPHADPGAHFWQWYASDGSYDDCWVWSPSLDW